MYHVTFFKSHARRYQPDNLEMLIKDIEKFLELHPKRKVIIEVSSESKS